jgi:hypothetical protein
MCASASLELLDLRIPIRARLQKQLEESGPMRSEAARKGADTAKAERVLLGQARKLTPFNVIWAGCFNLRLLALYSLWVTYREAAVLVSKGKVWV